MEQKIQFVLLGVGETWANFYFGDLPAKYPGRAGAFIGFSEELAHLIEAGADMFLMPSRFEPCGLNQMYSQRYGTLPIVRAIGGLKDTVINFSESPKPHLEKGTGFAFNDLTANAIYDTVGWAVYTYYNKKKFFDKMVQNAMSRDFSWEKAAAEYTALYREAIIAKNGSL
jgi:starch synthase